MQVPYDVTILLLEIYPMHTLAMINENICIGMFIAALVVQYKLETC